MISILAALVVCATFVCGFMVLTAYRVNMREITVKDRNRLQKIVEKNPTHHVDPGKIDTKCDVCFGEFGKEMIRVCDCGRTFHVDCTDATGECPYCKRKTDSMKLRNAVKTVCPACGDVIERNICSCGTVIPNRDGTYECRCGETLSVSDEKCIKCGSGIRVEIGN